MPVYSAPTRDMKFLLHEVLGFEDLTKYDAFSEVDSDLADAVIDQAAKFAEDVLAPLQRPGDLHPARLENGVVRTSPGYDRGYRAIADGGWVSIVADPRFGGMGLPLTVATAVNEMMAAALVGVLPVMVIFLFLQKYLVAGLTAGAVKE